MFTIYSKKSKRKGHRHPKYVDIYAAGIILVWFVVLFGGFWWVLFGWFWVLDFFFFLRMTAKPLKQIKDSLNWPLKHALHSTS